MITVMIKSAIVLAVAACIAGMLRRQSAALRHAVWTAGLFGALLVPLCSVTLPVWQNGCVGWAEQLFRSPGESSNSGDGVAPARQLQSQASEPPLASNAGTATIENDGAPSGSSLPGKTEFRNNASAASATINNRGPPR